MADTFKAKLISSSLSPQDDRFHCAFALRISYFLANSMHLKKYYFYPTLQLLSLNIYNHSLRHRDLDILVDNPFTEVYPDP